MEYGYVDPRSGPFGTLYDAAAGGTTVIAAPQDACRSTPHVRLLIFVAVVSVVEFCTVPLTVIVVVALNVY
jgi:hypothetical protein